MAEPKKIVCVVGARPNLMKVAPILRAFEGRQDILHGLLVHTGQHYDYAMNHRFFEDLELPWPAVNLGVGSSSHVVQIANVMLRFQPVMEAEKPEAILVVGDVNSTLACSLVANRMGVPVIHVEAGLRSFDRTMPEEINRILTDQLSDLLFTTEATAEANLLREGIASDRIRFVGNVMIDSLQTHLQNAIPMAETMAADERFLSAKEDGFGLVTLHRPSNVDDPEVLRNLAGALRKVAERLPLVFPMHPRTRVRLGEDGIAELTQNARIFVIEPLGYLEMLGAMRDARLVLTDSGGVQEETTALGVPCLTLRKNTERPITVTQGTNHLVGIDPEAIQSMANHILDKGKTTGAIPDLWDGRAAERIAKEIEIWLARRSDG